jgi:DNA-binding XRE family transcriptional regulator
MTLMLVAETRYRGLSENTPGPDQPSAGWASYDRASFLAEFFPHEGADIAAGAEDLLARSQPQSLADARRRAGLSQAQVAQRLGVGQEQVSAIERADPGATDVHTLAAYVAALGGELEVTADIGAGRVLLY